MRKLHSRKARGRTTLIKIEKTPIDKSVKHFVSWYLQLDCDEKLDVGKLLSHINRLHLARNKVEVEYEECG